MRARASIALSMTVLLSTASLVSTATFATAAAMASEATLAREEDAPLSIAQKLGSADGYLSPPPPSPVPKAAPPPSPVPKAAPPIPALFPNALSLPPSPSAKAGPSATRVARPGLPLVPPSSSSPPLVPSSLTRVARPGTLVPAQVPAQVPAHAQAPTSGSAPTLISPQVPTLVPTLVPALAPGGSPPQGSAPQAFGQPPGYNALGNAPIKDSYPAIGHLEQVTLGSSSPADNIDHRLASLENAIFKKTFEYDSLFDRTERLKKTVLGTQEVDPNSAAGREEAAAGRSAGQRPGTVGGTAGGAASGSDWIDNPHPALESLTEVHYLDEQAALPENMTAASAPELGQYAVSLLNRERQAYGVAAVTPDNVAEQMAGELASDLAKRNVLSHFNSAGDGPDRRLTLLEGADALNEGIASVKTAEVGSKRMCKAAVARILKTMLGRQDDRDALLNPDATHVGFALALTADRERVVAAVEVLTRHAIMIPVASDVKVGDKIEVRGVLQSPYLFDKVTVAWESYNPEASASAPESQKRRCLTFHR
jgi:uncharacterized protein YkwD